MKKRTPIVLSIILVVLAVLGPGHGLSAQRPGPETLEAGTDEAIVGTSFTYQGRLTDGGSDANGNYDLEFRLYEDPDGTTQVGDFIPVEDYPVEDGLLTIDLDFGDRVFVGETRYLEIQVRAGDSTGSFTPLLPRQKLTPAPMALSLPGLYTVPNSFSPNVVGGALENIVWDDLVGATISGGGGVEMENTVTDRFCTIGGGANNLAGDESPDVTDAWFATVGGGWENQAVSQNATVGGGAENVASGASSFVGGGYQNQASGELHATVGGGVANQASGANNATVGGGDHNVASGEWNATVAGGANNHATGNEATVSGGAENVASGESFATVGGGYRNTAGETDATVGGGNTNTASGWAATIGGGVTNTITASLGTVSGGSTNSALGWAATVAGGEGNRAAGNWSTVGGGAMNEAAEEDATITGGSGNSAGGVAATVSGGAENTAPGVDSAVGGGRQNEAHGDRSVVAGGYWNVTYGLTSTISGGQQNFINRDHATIGGGRNNQIYGDFGTIGGGGGDDEDGANIVYDRGGTVAGGTRNTAGSDDADPASALNATVAGGLGNQASAEGATVGGGAGNIADGHVATVGGGWVNTASGTEATVGGGRENSAGGDYATVGGGDGNDAYGNGSTVGGGIDNQSSFSATVSGGEENAAGGNWSSIGGGYSNDASQSYATVSGGASNHASGYASAIGGGSDQAAMGEFSTVAGGLLNQATSMGATIGGGGAIASVIESFGNTASGDYSTIAGGAQNTADGWGSSIPGGMDNFAVGRYSLAAGQRAKAYNDGCFVWGDSTDSNVTCESDDRFVVRASGGVYLYTSGDLSSGAYLGSGMSTWNPLPPPSDRNLKENVVPVDPAEILEEIAAMPISTWNYTSQDTGIRHMGPMAQDFYAAFGLGEDDQHISTIDADGAALAAIQGLHQISEERGERIEELEAENEALRNELDDLGARVRDLEQGSQRPVQSKLLPGAGLVVASIGAAWATGRGRFLTRPAGRIEP